ncbi:MAG: DNA polymerase IV [Caldilineaceae bacterium]|nr:DNA polymerase IV [Caldilineaceae bacterium]
MSIIRKILHLDLDAFFCAVEEQRDPALRGKAFAVGGKPAERGVVASCSYPARLLGIHSALPMSQAVRLCPELIIVPARHRAYRRRSLDVMARLHALTPLVEQLSIDEAFLDVTHLPDPAEATAHQLQAQIRNELDLPCSLGVAANKLVAKIANNMGKAAAKGSGRYPNAITVVPAGTEASFLAPLPCEELWGVGPKTAHALHGLGIQTIGDLASWPESALVARFGKHGQDLARHAKGIDERAIETRRESKSISQETTFTRDVRDETKLRQTVREQAEGVANELRRKRLTATTVKLKLRWSDFTTLTRQTTFAHPTDSAEEIYVAVVRLFQNEWDGRLVRLVGVGVSGLGNSARQLSLWEAPEERREREKAERLQQTLQRLRQRFGDDVVHLGVNEQDEGMTG